MAKPSLFTQLNAVPVGSRLLKESPRHWNCGMLRYKNRLWLCYRYHVKEKGGRCATAICEINQDTLQPAGKSQWLALSGPTGTEHHEDARLWLFKGEPYISYTEMRGYRPGIDYTCVIKYAKLRLRGAKWEVVDAWQPIYGRNDGRAKEKNWVFFEYDGAVHVVYSGSPAHQVLRLQGELVTKVYDAPGPAWHFGVLRGGTPPLRQPDGTYLSIFHSSVATEVAPHFVRYYGAAYTFEGKPPFAPLRISTRPMMVGSEADGHQVDPRYVEGWKPYVVFPCGMVPQQGDADGGQANGWYVSLGINDWQCGIARLRPDQLYLGAANGSDIPPRYFRRPNGTLPVPVFNDGGRKQLLEWTVPRPPFGMAGVGYMLCHNPRQAQEVAEFSQVEEIGFYDYDLALAKMRATV